MPQKNCQVAICRGKRNTLADSPITDSDRRIFWFDTNDEGILASRQIQKGWEIVELCAPWVHKEDYPRIQENKGGVLPVTVNLDQCRPSRWHAHPLQGHTWVSEPMITERLCSGNHWNIHPFLSSLVPRRRNTVPRKHISCSGYSVLRTLSGLYSDNILPSRNKTSHFL